MGDKSKNGREERVGAHWEHEVGEGKKTKNKMKDGNSISFGSGKVEQVETKKEIQA